MEKEKGRRHPERKGLGLGQRRPGVGRRSLVTERKTLLGRSKVGQAGLEGRACNNNRMHGGVGGVQRVGEELPTPAGA